MTTKEFKEKHTDEDLEIVTEFLSNYRELLEDESPEATNAISRVTQVLMDIPDSMEDL